MAERWNEQTAKSFADLADTAKLLSAEGTIDFNFTKAQLITYLDTLYTAVGDVLLAANNLSDLDDAATARTNLGLAIGTDVQAQDALLQTIADASDFDDAGLVDKTTAQDDISGTKGFQTINVEEFAGGASSYKPAEIYNVFSDISGYGENGLDGVVPAAFSSLMHLIKRGGTITADKSLSLGSLANLVDGTGNRTGFLSSDANITITMTLVSAISFARRFKIWFRPGFHATEFDVKFYDSSLTLLDTQTVTGWNAPVWNLDTGTSQYTTKTIEIILKAGNTTSIQLSQVSWSEPQNFALFPHALSRQGGSMHGNIDFLQGATSKIRTAEAQSLVLGANLSDNLTIDTTGRVTLSDGLILGAGSDVLEDYEEGTFTPTVTFQTVGNFVPTYNTQFGRYTRIGDLVTFEYYIDFTSNAYTTAAGDIRFSGLPFVVPNEGGTLKGVTISRADNVVFLSGRQSAGALRSNQSFINFIEFITSGSWSNAGVTEFPASTTFRVGFKGSYFV